MQSNKDKYRELCRKEDSIPIFSRDWWLDAVCDEGIWDVVMVEKGGEIVATLPFYMKTKYGFKLIEMPKLTQTMGIWIKYPAYQRYQRKLEFEKELITDLIRQLPKFAWFRQNFYPVFSNWLPFYWNGFNQTTHYTYVIPHEPDMESLFANFRDKTRNQIRKAKHILTVNSNDDIESFYKTNALSFERQNRDIRFSFEFLERLDKICVKNRCRKILFATDTNGEIHSAIYLVWDDYTVYYLLGGSDPKFRNSSANSLLIWEGIKFAVSKSKNFDFEGSMNETHERFFRSFGAKQTAYFRIEKINSKLIKLKRSCL